MTLMILGAVWGLLTSTRLLRGEEDSGRWDLLLVGQTTRRGAAVQAIVGLGVGVLGSVVVTAVITIAVGPTRRCNIAAGSVAVLRPGHGCRPRSCSSPSVHVTSQVAATRRQAASYGAVILGVSYAIRLIADAGVGLHGLIWASPLGWVEELQPLTAP